jgi:hypothetical protein
MRRLYLGFSLVTAFASVHPGFDTRVYPGDAAMRTWRTSSPYEWTAYYLVAPCQTGTSWVGKRTTVRDMGYGMAVVFLGEQDWPVNPARDSAAARRDSAAARRVNAAAQPKQCTASNLTVAKGEVDAARADSTAAAEGFASGTVVYLDVERAEAISSNFETYIRAWFRAMLRSTRYRPGVYMHEKNADAVHAIALSEYARAGRAGEVPFWVAARGTSAFDLTLAPDVSGYSYATIWQGRYNTPETWGGVTIKVDANVAASADPSGGR